jgi:hypothetical protein
MMAMFLRLSITTVAFTYRACLVTRTSERSEAKVKISRGVYLKGGKFGIFF